jgi:uncharacterized protein YjcR
MQVNKEDISMMKRGPLNSKLLKGNKNAAGNKARLITGEYETITWNTLTDFETGAFTKTISVAAV